MHFWSMDMSACRLENLFDVGFVNGLLEVHWYASEDYANRITALLTFKLWRESFQITLP
jgi:hypothetical protein